MFTFKLHFKLQVLSNRPQNWTFFKVFARIQCRVFFWFWLKTICLSAIYSQTDKKQTLGCLVKSFNMKFLEYLLLRCYYLYRGMPIPEAELLYMQEVEKMDGYGQESFHAKVNTFITVSK